MMEAAQKLEMGGGRRVPRIFFSMRASKRSMQGIEGSKAEPLAFARPLPFPLAPLLQGLQPFLSSSEIPISPSPCRGAALQRGDDGTAGPRRDVINLLVDDNPNPGRFPRFVRFIIPDFDAGDERVPLLACPMCPCPALSAWSDARYDLLPLRTLGRRLMTGRFSNLMMMLCPLCEGPRTA